MPNNNKFHQPSKAYIKAVTSRNEQLTKSQGAMPNKIKCGRCDKVKGLDAFSTQQRMNLQSQLAGGKTPSNTKRILCMTCAGMPAQELRCAQCHQWKGLNAFAKRQRKDPDNALCIPCQDQVSAYEPEDGFKLSTSPPGSDDEDEFGYSEDDDDGETGYLGSDTEADFNTGASSFTLDDDSDKDSAFTRGKVSSPNTLIPSRDVPASGGGVRLPGFSAPSQVTKQTTVASTTNTHSVQTRWETTSVTSMNTQTTFKQPGVFNPNAYASRKPSVSVSSLTASGSWATLPPTPTAKTPPKTSARAAERFVRSRKMTEEEFISGKKASNVAQVDDDEVEHFPLPTRVPESDEEGEESDSDEE